MVRALVRRLHIERAELEREYEGVRIGISAYIIAGHYQGADSGRASELSYGKAPHVVPEREAVQHVSVQSRYHEARARDGDKEVDLVGLDPRFLEYVL